MTAVHPINAPLPGIAIRSRPDFASWLRQRKMIRYDAHQVARNPGARWLVMHGSDGWIRAIEASPAPKFNRDIQRRTARKLARAGIVVTEAYVMRFTKLPIDS